MPRQARLDISGALHHIMIRGANRGDIFYDEQDRQKFLERLGANVTEAKCSIYAWAQREAYPLRDGENAYTVAPEEDVELQGDYGRT